MKKTQLTDAKRNIRRQIISYISIVVIALVAVSAYLGIAYPAVALRRGASDYLNRFYMWDLEVTSTLLMDQEDLDALRAVPGVKAVEPVFEVSAGLRLPHMIENVSVMSLTRDIATPELMEGRLPSAAGECAVEEELVKRHGLAIGQSITVENDDFAGTDPLLQKDYIITGVFHHPDHISFEVPATPYLLVADSSFSRDDLNGAFMKARILVADTPVDRFGDEYYNTVLPVEDAIEAMADERAQLRRDRLAAELEDSIREGREELDAAEQELQDAADQLETSKAELAEAEEQLQESKKLLDDGEAQLNEAQSRLDTEKDDFEAQKAAMPAPQVQQMEAVFLQKEEELQQNRDDWSRSRDTYLEGLTAYEDGKRELEAGERDYADGLNQVEDAKKALADAQRELDSLGSCHWVVLDNRCNTGIDFAKTNADSLSSISLSFSLIFLGIAALVIYSTIGRMVEEQRKLVGTAKAMGLYNREVFFKYLLFGVSATALGVLLGILFSFFGIQWLMLFSEGIPLTYGTVPPAFLPLETLVVILCALILSYLAVRFACAGLLRSSAITLMADAPPKGVRKTGRSASAKSLYTRLIFRNLRTDLLRVIVTTVSIAGCCLLLMAGFNLKFAISRVNPRQFGQIIRFDGELYFDRDKSASVEEDLQAVLERNGQASLAVQKTDAYFDGGEILNVATVITADADAITDFYGLLDYDTRRPLRLSDDGALVSGGFRDYFSLSAGDSFSLYDSDLNPVDVRIAGVFNNYLGHRVFFTPAGYQRFFEESAEPNCFLVRLDGMSLDELREQVQDIAGFHSLKDAAAERARFDIMSMLLNVIIVTLLILAAVMVYFILMNLTMTYIQRKTRELTVMRINGFTTRECIVYAAWDLLVTTVVGIAVGLAVGNRIGSWIARMLEGPYAQFVREPDLRTFVFSALITLVFSLIVNGYALGKIRNLKLADINS